MSLEKALSKIERVLAKVWRAREEKINSSDVSFNEYYYLNTLMELDRPRLSDIAEQLGVSKASASTMMSKLRDKGLVIKIASLEDKRSFRFHLSEQGAQFMDVDLEVYQGFVKRVRGVLTEEEFESYRLINIKLSQNL